MEIRKLKKKENAVFCGLQVGSDPHLVHSLTGQSNEACQAIRNSVSVTMVTADKKDIRENVRSC